MKEECMTASKKRKRSNEKSRNDFGIKKDQSSLPTAHLESKSTDASATRVDEHSQSLNTTSMSSPPFPNIQIGKSPPPPAIFEALGVKKWLIGQCAKMGIDAPTPVQSNCIPEIFNGRDVLGCARTGTGKTLAFALPIIQKLAQDPHGIYALIVTPTRELAEQIREQFLILGQAINLRCVLVMGGRGIIEQGRDLSQRPHIVVCTPGRLKDLIESSGDHVISDLFDKLKFLVLDEADRLLAGQYTLQLKSIFGILPKQRQTLLFSATITDALDHLHQLSMRKPFYWKDHFDDESLSTVAELDQRYVLCPADYKDAYLVFVVKQFLDKYPQSSVLIFSHTCREVQALTGMFQHLDFRVAALHSMIQQKFRSASLSRFRNSKVRVLLCTDVAARGLDIPTVDLVVCHNVPAEPKCYVHRVGRAARAGRHGSAISFVTQYDVSLLQAIEHNIQHKLTQLQVDDSNVQLHVTEVLVAKRESEIKLDRENFGEQREQNRKKQLIIEGIDPDEVEATLLKRRQERAEANKKSMHRMQNTAEKHKRSGLASKGDKLRGDLNAKNRMSSKPLKVNSKKQKNAKLFKAKKGKGKRKKK